MPFHPRFAISTTIARDLMRIEAARQAVADLPVNKRVLAGLRQSAQLLSTHYSTQIEGNQLSPKQVQDVILRGRRIEQQPRDEAEVKGYYAALDLAQQYAATERRITEAFIRRLHATVMAGGKLRKRGSSYRDGQNVIRDAATGGIVYLPPEAHDVPMLMRDLVAWIDEQAATMPIPIIAGVAHYQFATIHPWYDGNGRVARLLTNAILHQHGYGLHGIYNLEAYYARRLADYYDALAVGESHNYYFGRAEADITAWLAYFIPGMAASFEAVRAQMQQSTHAGDQPQWFRSLDARQRQVLALFDEWQEITTPQVEELLNLSPRGARAVMQQWVEAGFLEVANPSKRGRTYRLARRATVH